MATLTFILAPLTFIHPSSSHEGFSDVCSSFVGKHFIQTSKDPPPPDIVCHCHHEQIWEINLGKRSQRCTCGGRHKNPNQTQPKSGSTTTHPPADCRGHPVLLHQFIRPERNREGVGKIIFYWRELLYFPSFRCVFLHFSCISSISLYFLPFH